MMRSTVVMVAEAVMKLDISIPDLGPQGPPEVDALAGLVNEGCNEQSKIWTLIIWVRICDGIRGRSLYLPHRKVMASSSASENKTAMIDGNDTKVSDTMPVERLCNGPENLYVAGPIES
jgi:hypothetical protein